MLEIRSGPSGQRWIREELIKVLRWLNKKLQDVRLEEEKTMLSRQIRATDAAIRCWYANYSGSQGRRTGDIKN